ncbi:MAG: hypothetical protein N3F05_01395 [Candidatus Diapherotrites archaeon]|nr:hypothetical protein [Candidatus Diapherotrites archaeon]
MRAQRKMTTKYAEQLKVAAEQLRCAKKAGIRIGYANIWNKSQDAAFYRALGRRRLPLKIALAALIGTNPALRSAAISALSTKSQSFLMKHVPKALESFAPEQRARIQSELAFVSESITSKEHIEMGKIKAQDLPEHQTKKYLLTRRKPYLATPFIKSFFEKANKLKAINNQLKLKFGRGYVGMIVRGSMAKGYFVPQSDIDVVFIGTAPRLEMKALQLCRKYGLKLDAATRLINPKAVMPRERPIILEKIFSGIFFGDKKALKSLQMKIFRGMSKDEWELLRSTIFNKEAANFEKAFERFGIRDPNEKRRIIVAIGYRLPPKYEEMKKLLGIERNVKH